MELRPETDPVLHLRCQEITIDELTTDYFEGFCMKLVQLAMDKQALGVAAPQVGSTARVMVVCKLDHLVYTNPSYWVMVNPELVEKSAVIMCEKEGCLSFPGLELSIRRCAWVRARWTNPDGSAHDVTTLEGLSARCFQHELDHLDGITFDKRVSKWRLEPALEKRARRLRRAS